MNFYINSADCTIIKSVNSTRGCKFNKIFSADELSWIWELIKSHKRISTIVIFLFFIFFLYGVIFPNYYYLINEQNLYIISIIFLIIVFIIYSTVTFLSSKCFESNLRKKFGEFEKIKFKPTNDIDTRYYKLFKIELLKALSLILVIVLCLGLGSPFKIVVKSIAQQKYNDAIQITTIGSKLFPIAPEWYSLRGYSKYQLKDYQGAIKDYDKAYQLGTDEYNVMNFDNKIFIKYYIKDYKGALADFDYEIKKSADDYEKDSFLWDKAQFLYNIKKYDEALTIYNDLIIKAESDNIFLLKNRLYFERAQVYKSLGKEDLANQDLENTDALNIENSFKNPIPQPVLLLNGI